MKLSTILCGTFVLLVIDIVLLRKFALRPESFIFVGLIVAATAVFVESAKEIRQ